MVRNIVGSLLPIGEGHKPVSWLETLEKKDRTQAGITAPAVGLYFVGVHYPAPYQFIPCQPYGYILFGANFATGQYGGLDVTHQGENLRHYPRSRRTSSRQRRGGCLGLGVLSAQSTRGNARTSAGNRSWRAAFVTVTALFVNPSVEEVQRSWMALESTSFNSTATKTSFLCAIS